MVRTLTGYPTFLDGYSDGLKIHQDGIIGGMEVLTQLGEELSVFQNVSFAPIIELPCNSGKWSSGCYAISGNFSPDSKPFRNCPPTEKTVDFRIFVTLMTHITGLPFGLFFANYFLPMKIYRRKNR